MLLGGEIREELPMSTKRNRTRRHSFSSLEEAARKIAQEPKVSETAACAVNMPAEQLLSARGSGVAGYNSRKRPLPIDAALANDANPAKKFAMMSGGLTMEELLKSGPSVTQTAGGDQFLCLPGGERVGFVNFASQTNYVERSSAWCTQTVLPYYLRDGMCMLACAAGLAMGREVGCSFRETVVFPVARSISRKSTSALFPPRNATPFDLNWVHFTSEN